MGCDEIMTMVEDDYDTEIIVESLRSTGEVPSSATIACLEERGAPTPIITLARELAGQTASPPRAPDRDQSEEGISASVPTTPVDLATARPPPPPPVSRAPLSPALKGYLVAGLLTGAGGVLLGRARFIRADIQQEAQDGSLPFSEGEAMAQTSNRSLYLGYTGVGLGLAMAASTRIFWTTSVGPGAVSIGGRW
jgi:hypothetical protein